MTRDADDIRYIPINGLQADILSRLAELLAGKDVPEGVVYLVGMIPRSYDEATA